MIGSVLTDPYTIGPSFAQRSNFDGPEQAKSERAGVQATCDLRPAQVMRPASVSVLAEAGVAVVIGT